MRRGIRAVRTRLNGLILPLVFLFVLSALLQDGRSCRAPGVSGGSEIASADAAAPSPGEPAHPEEPAHAEQEIVELLRLERLSHARDGEGELPAAIDVSTALSLAATAAPSTPLFSLIRTCNTTVLLL